MKRAALIKHLKTHGCRLLREGARHSWWVNVVEGQRTAVPRHREIGEALVRKLCRDLGVPPPQERK